MNRHSGHGCTRDKRHIGHGCLILQPSLWRSERPDTKFKNVLYSCRCFTPRLHRVYTAVRRPKVLYTASAQSNRNGRIEPINLQRSYIACSSCSLVLEIHTDISCDFQFTVIFNFMFMRTSIDFHVSQHCAGFKFIQREQQRISARKALAPSIYQQY